jgi:hypothetical protein
VATTAGRATYWASQVEFVMNVTGTRNAGCRDLQLRQSRTSWLDPGSGLIVRDESVVDETVSSFPVRSNVTAQLFSSTPA